MTARRRGALAAAGVLLVGLAVVYRGVLRGQVLLGRDAYRVFIPDSAFLLECLRNGELPLWNPYLRLGQPFAATLQSQAFYPPHYLALIAGPVVGYTVQQLLHVALAFVGTYLLCRRLRASGTAAILGGAAFALSAMFADLSSQRNVADAAAWTGFVLLAAEAVARRPSFRSVAGLAAAGGLSFLAGSPETVIWQVLLSLGFAAGGAVARRRGREGAARATGAGLTAIRSGSADTRARHEGDAATPPPPPTPGTSPGDARARHGGRAASPVRGVGALLAAWAWAFGLGAVIGLPGWEFARNSLRASGAAADLRWSVSWAQLLSMVWPLADHPRVGYWDDDQWFVLSLFLGTLTVLLAAVGLTRWRRAPAIAFGWPLLALLSVGAHFLPAAALLRLPPLSMFRFPAKYYVGAAFCVAVLAALGVDRVAAWAHREGSSVRRLAVAVIGGLVAIGAGLPLTRLPVFRTGAQGGWLWLVVFVMLALAVVWAAPAEERRYSQVRTGLVGLALLELLGFQLMLGVSGWGDPAQASRPSALAAFLPKPFTGRLSVEMEEPEPDPYKPGPPPRQAERSRDLLIPNRSVEERLRSLEGYGAPEPKDEERFQLSGSRAIYDLTGVTHYVRLRPAPFADLERVETPPELPALYRSSTALPRAFVVTQATVADDVAVLRALDEPAQPGRTQVFLAPETPGSAEASCSDSTASITAERTQSLEVSVKSCGPGYLVLSDAHYPGWEATLDGAAVPILRADVALRAVRIPSAGTHAVHFRYRPGSFTVGAVVSMLGWLAVLVAVSRRRTSAAA